MVQAERPQPVALPTIDFVEEPVVCLEADGCIRFANAATWCWFGEGPREAFGELFPKQPWHRVINSLDKYGTFRFEAETSPGAKRALPVEVRVTRRQDDGAIVLRASDQTRLVEKDVMLASFASMVEAHNAKIRRQNQQLQELLDNLKQAVFCIDGQGRTKGPVSAHANALFGESFEGLPAVDTLFRLVKRETEAYSRLVTALATTLGEDELQWEMQCDGLPRRVIYQNSVEGAAERVLQLNYTPIYDAARCVQKILVVVEDRTETEALQRAVDLAQQVSQQNLAMLQELSEVDKTAVEAFFGNASRALLNQAARVRTLRQGDRAEIDALFRVLHTLKGDARAFGLSLFAVAVHEVECQVMPLRDGTCALDEPERSNLRRGVREASASLEAYRRLGTRVFNLQDDVLATVNGTLRRALFAIDASHAVAAHPALQELVDAAAGDDALLGKAQLLANRAGQGLDTQDAFEDVARLVIGRLLEGSALIRFAAEDVRKVSAPYEAALVAASALDPMAGALMHNAAAAAQSNGWLFLTAIAERQESIAGGDDPSFAMLTEQAERFLELARLRFDGGCRAVVRQVLRSHISFDRVLVELAALEESGNKIATAVRRYLVASGPLEGSGLPGTARLLDLLGFIGHDFGDGSVTMSQLSPTTDVVAANVDRVRSLLDDVMAGRRPAEALKQAAMWLAERAVGSVAQRLKPMALELGRSLGKQLSFRLEGAEHLLDRDRLDVVNDALVHIVRNAIDHGLERPADRLAANKPQLADLRVTFGVLDGQVQVTVADDGHGINTAAVCARAVETGLVTPTEAADLSPEQIYPFIFHPGLSTASAVGAVSGRGVGMDVVMVSVRKLGGSIKVTSEPGVGTSVFIAFPL